MNCPKCGHEQAGGSDECGGCGLIFAKYWKHHAPTEATPAEARQDGPAVVIDEPRDRFALWLPHEPPDGLVTTGRLLALALLIWIGIPLMFSNPVSNASGKSFLHLINLPFHEGGHVVFGVFGQFMGSAGGTLMQLLIPAACFYHFLFRQANAFAAGIALWWFGENLVDIAPYICDASVGELPLLGGNIGKHAPYGFHDWEYLLVETGLIHSDQAIGWTSHVLGSLVMLIALAWCSLLVIRQLRA